ncbi:MAG: tetratricopeptide repeat protein [Mariprofundaceae bacterium]
MGKQGVLSLLSCIALMFFSMSVQASTLSTTESFELFENGREAYLKGEFEEALQLLLKAAKQDGKNSEIQYQTGLVYQGMLDYQTAKKYFNQAVKLDKTNASAWAHLGEILYRDHEYSKANKSLDKALKYANKAYNHYIKGLVLTELKDYSQALKSLKKAYKLRPSYRQKAIYSIGLVHSKTQDKKLAEAAFKEAIKIKPDSYVGVVADLALHALHRPEPRLWHVNLNYTITYDDNVILKPDENNPQLQGLAQGDFVHALSIFGTHKLFSKGKFNLNANVSVYKTMHHELTHMNSDMLSAWLTPSYKLALGTLAVDIRANTSWVAGTRYMEALGASPHLSFNFSKSQSGSLTTSYQRQHFVKQTQIATAENRDSNHFSVGYSHNLRLNKQASIGLGYSYHYGNSKGANWDSRGHNVSSSLQYLFNPKLSWQAGANYSTNQYRNTHSTANVKRSSKGLGLSSSLSYQMKPITLQLRYAHTRNKDNVSIYQYRRNTMGVGIQYYY